MSVAYAVFGFYLLVIAFGAGVAALSANLVRALVGLMFSFLGVAGMYMLMQAQFLAFMQILIYAGAIGVLVFFALMLARSAAGGDEAGAPRKKTLRSLATGLVFLVVLVPGLLTPPPGGSTETPAVLPVQELGSALVNDFVLPFELISVILLVSMAGGVFLIWERRK